jgi:hypothetical protein
MIFRSFFIVAFLFRFCLLNAQNFMLNTKLATTEPAQTSVLASGTWNRIKIYKDGVYKLTYEDIISMGFSDPANIRIFGNGGTMLPLMNTEPRYDDLIENTLYMSKGTDGNFNEGDFILFYGKGPVTWTYNSYTTMYEHKLNLFSNASYYYLTTDAGIGKKIITRAAISGNPALFVTSFDDYSYHEKDYFNLLKSGRQWFGEKIHHEVFDSTFVFSGLQTGSPVKLKINVASRSRLQKAFVLFNNDITIGTISLPPIDLEDKITFHATQKTAQYSFFATSPELNIKLEYSKTESTDEGYLDYITINTRRKLSLVENALPFRDRSSSGSSLIARYSVENCNSQTEIWDVTDPFNITRMETRLSGNILTFSDSTLYLKEYLAVNVDASFPKPEIKSKLSDLGLVSNQNLHASLPHQMLIVTHPLFREAADSLAEFHRVKDNMSVLVATTDQVYNEFSSGIADVSAIRDFARMLYNRATSESNRLKYLLLFGDGSYNNFSQAAGNSNFIPTYQSENSLNASFSYVSDDFFGFMDEVEGGNATMEKFSLDLGIGRLPAKNAEEAMALYNKIKNYNQRNTMFDWRNNILFVGDDEDGNRHMIQANTLADEVSENNPQFAVKKVLLDAYPQVTSSSGARYPDASQIILNNIEKGLLIFNYTGHGSESTLSAEHVLTGDHLRNLTNQDNLPLFITATCEFSRFDDLSIIDKVLSESTSAGEISLVNPHGGSIALITTTRIVYSDENHLLNTKFYEIVFKRDSNGDFYKLGDITRITKNATEDNRNKLNFILLGDPALCLAIPNYSIVTDSLNGVSVSEPTDTLKAFSRIRISGHIEDRNNGLLEDFNGTVYPSVFDKNKTATTLANDDKRVPTMLFQTREDLIYKGKASVVNGRFSYEFLVPKDITYSFGNGKITYYASDLKNDATGYFSGCIIGGTDASTISDQNGPEISLYLNDEYFNNEGITNANPVIYARITDESGINTIGNGIGHDITGIIDENANNPVVMNDYFEAELDNYTSGILRYPMENLDAGWHSLRLKVWDVFNNSAERTIDFKVISGDQIVISNAGNYPNPAIDQTSFIFEHNKPDEEIMLAIEVYDLQGRLITSIRETIITAGFSSTPRNWDLKDLNGNSIKPGLYPYRIRITDKRGSFTDSYQKLMVIR